MYNLFIPTQTFYQKKTYFERALFFRIKRTLIYKIIKNLPNIEKQEQNDLKHKDESIRNLHNNKTENNSI